MPWYEYVFGISSAVGMVFSLITLITTSSTKSALKKYRNKLDIEALQKALVDYANVKNKGNVNRQTESLAILTREIDRYTIFYKGKISDDLKSALSTTRNDISSLNGNLHDKNLQGALNANISTLSIYLEKESASIPT